MHWSWEEITDIRLWPKEPNFFVGFYPPKIKSITKKRKIIFVLNPGIKFNFTLLCSNEEMNQKFVDELASCNYTYIGKNS